MSDNQYDFLKHKHKFSNDQIYMIKGFDKIARQYGSIQHMIEESMRMRTGGTMPSNALKVLDAAIMWQMVIGMLKNKENSNTVDVLISKINALMSDL